MHVGARRQGALAPHAARHPKFGTEDLCIFIDFGCFTGRFVLFFWTIALVTIVPLFIPKNTFFQIET